MSVNIESVLSHVDYVVSPDLYDKNLHLTNFRLGLYDTLSNDVIEIILKRTGLTTADVEHAGKIFLRRC